MADNIPLPNTAINVATDDIAGVHYPRTKITLGAEGVNGGDVSAANPLPVALDATSLAALENINVTVDNLTVGLTDAQLRATPVPVSGTVTVANPTATGLTDTQLRASAVPVSGTIELGATSLAALENVTATISNPTTSVSVSNFPATQAVSGTVTANTGLTQPLTDTQLRATAVPVSIASVPAHDVNIKSSGGANIVTDGAGNLTVAGSVIDGSAPGTRVHLIGGTDGTLARTIRTDSAGRAIIAGSSANGGAIGSSNPILIAGSDGTTTRNISTDATGKINVVVTSAPTTAVTGTFWQATQPVSGPLTDAQLRASAVPVSIASVPSHAVTNAGTFAVQVTSAPTTTISGQQGEAASMVGINPVLISGRDPSFNARTLRVSTAGVLDVAVNSSTLPTGAATETTVATLSTEATLLALKALQEEIKAQTEVVEYALMALLDKIAMPDRFDRTRVVISDNVGNEASGPYYPLNTGVVGDNGSGKLWYRSSEPWLFHDTASTRIYNGIVVS